MDMVKGHARKNRINCSGGSSPGQVQTGGDYILNPVFCDLFLERCQHVFGHIHSQHGFPSARRMLISPVPQPNSMAFIVAERFTLFFIDSATALSQRHRMGLSHLVAEALKYSCGFFHHF
ncbi:MAG: hypothetical protein R2875_09800 [Desulfobacterales bacterium]